MSHTLQAVHSGADLQSAAATVMGYEQVTMKGKAISVAPVPGVATARLQSLLDGAMLATEALPEEENPSGTAAGVGALGHVRRLMKVRLELLPAMALGNKGCADRFRFVACAHHKRSDHAMYNVIPPCKHDDLKVTA